MSLLGAVVPSLLAVTLAAATAARAGIADSPLPVLVAGQTTLHLYSVPGVKGAGGTNLATYISCTSTSSSPQTVGVEVFADTGGAPLNNAATTAVLVPAGGSVRFGTSDSFAFGTNQSLSIAVDNGSARILSTSKLLVCTAFIADEGNPPVSMVQLTIIKGVKQKAAN